MTDSPPPAVRPPIGRVLAAIFLIAAVVLAVFVPVLRSGFVAFDDIPNVVRNPYLNPVTSATLPRFWNESYYELYTPVTYSLWTIAAIPQRAQTTHVSGTVETRLDPGLFHALGVSLHLANALLVFLLLLRLPGLRGQSPFLAAAGAILFAVHPLMAESVAWITGNNNVFSGFFLLLALLLFTKRLETDNEKHALLWYIAATIAYLLALLAKPTAAALPFVAAILAIGAYRTPARSLLLPLGTWIVLAGALLFVTRNTSDPVTDVSLPIWQRPFVAGDALSFYVQKLLVPIRMGIDYGRRPEWLREQWWSYVTWIVPVSIGALLSVWYLRTRSETARLVITGLSMFVFGVAPMLGFAPYYVHRYSTVADRYVYVGMIGVALAVSVSLSRVPKRYGTIAGAVTASLLLVCAFLCRKQTAVWKDSRSLFVHAIAVQPRSMMAHLDLAEIDKEELDYDGALRENRIAIGLPSEGTEMRALAHANLGDILRETGETDAAIAAYEEAIRLRPDIYENYVSLARTLWAAGKTDAARAAAAHALSAYGDQAGAFATIGKEFVTHGIPELGVPLLLRAASASDVFAADANYELGITARDAGNRANAERFLARAVELSPERSDARSALVALRNGGGSVPIGTDPPR